MTMSTTAPSAMPAEYGFREADDPQGRGRPRCLVSHTAPPGRLAMRAARMS